MTQTDDSSECYCCRCATCQEQSIRCFLCIASEQNKDDNNSSSSSNEICTSDGSRNGIAALDDEDDEKKTCEPDGITSSRTKRRQHESRSSSSSRKTLCRTQNQQQQNRLEQNGGSNNSRTVNNTHRITDRQKEQKSKPPRCSSVALLRCVVVNVPLLVLAASLLCVYGMQLVHDEYYVPLFRRAFRSDDDLLEEYTYYERACTEQDVTTLDLKDLMVKTKTPNHNNSSAFSYNYSSHQRQQQQDWLNIIMTHGALAVPRALSENTTRELREYIVERNEDVWAAEQLQFPMDHERRMSFGIDASEHPAVVRAVREVANHPVLLPILQAVTGDIDPASSEITVITAYAGVGPQTWHSDTKIDGNAVKFARTYSHSYSLFIPLQDITERMGATDLCPGSHYCAADQFGISDMCNRLGMGLHEITPEGVFPAGSGALLNQHVWHRGAAHTDPDAPERIVFIMSFLARPQYNIDPRQLSRGTYFHQKWNMWGHTVSDLRTAATHMRQPFSILRCLSAWKPATSKWGYDLITATFMRFANDQLEDLELESRFVARLDEIQFPKRLRGRIKEGASQYKQWALFIKGTLKKTLDFLLDVNAKAHVILLSAIFVVTCIRVSPKRAWSITRHTIRRLLLSDGILLALFLYGFRGVRQSEWGKSVSNGRMLMRPFSTIQQQMHHEPDITVVSGLESLPQRHDVLLGTRYDATFLGSYDNWLDYHPGNVVFRNSVARLASLYAAYTQRGATTGYGTVRTTLSQQVIQNVVDAIAVEHSPPGRFLQQDWRSGVWRQLSSEETKKTVQYELVATANPIIKTIRQTIRYMLAHYRFLFERNTALSRHSQWYLHQFEERIFSFVHGSNGLDEEKKASSFISSTDDNDVSAFMKKRLTTTAFSTFPHSTQLLPNTRYVPFHRRSMISRTIASTPPPPPQKFCVGSLVRVFYPVEGIWFPGAVLRVNTENKTSYDISYEDGTVEDGVEEDAMILHHPVVQGGEVFGCYRDGLRDCYLGTIQSVHPSGMIDIVYHLNGKVAKRMSPEYYYLPTPVGNVDFEPPILGQDGHKEVSDYNNDLSNNPPDSRYEELNSNDESGSGNFNVDYGYDMDGGEDIYDDDDDKF